MTHLSMLWTLPALSWRASCAMNTQTRHGTDLTMRCNQCGTSWPYSDDGPTQCSDCLDHLGEPIDAEHPDWCPLDHGCSLPAGHDGKCSLTAALCFCPTCEAKR